MPDPTPTPTTPHPDALKLPTRFDRCLLPQLTPDGRCVYSTDVLEYVQVTDARAGAHVALERHAGHEPWDARLPGLRRAWGHVAAGRGSRVGGVCVCVGWV